MEKNYYGNPHNPEGKMMVEADHYDFSDCFSALENEADIKFCRAIVGWWSQLCIENPLIPGTIKDYIHALIMVIDGSQFESIEELCFLRSLLDTGVYDEKI